MKVLQAIVASGTETLDNRQGYGLVRCSRNLPEPIRQKCRGIGYPEDAEDEPVFAYWQEQIEGSTWALLNRTGPTTDYSGRRSFVSHTLAIEWGQLTSFLDNTQCGEFTPCQLFRSFPWQDSWNDAQAAWIESDDDLAAESLSAPKPQGRDLAGQYSGLLQLFEFDDSDELQVRRVYLTGSPSNHDQALDSFDKAWLAVDPFLSIQDLGQHLPGPKIKPIDSWRASFITHLTGSQPDAFAWVILPRATQPPGNRAVLDFESLSTEAASDSLNDGLHDYLIARAKDPRDWAITTLQQRIADSSQTRRERENELVAEGRSRIDAIISEIESYATELPADQAIDQEALHAALEKNKAGIDQELLNKESKLKEVEADLRAKIGNLDSEYPHIGPLREALDALGEQATPHIAAGVDFSPLYDRFKQACSNVRWKCAECLYQRVYEPWHRELESKEARLTQWAQEIEPKRAALIEREAQHEKATRDLVAKQSKDGLSEGDMDKAKRSLKDKDKKLEERIDAARRQKRSALWAICLLGLMSIILCVLWMMSWSAEGRAIKSKEILKENLERTNGELNRQIKEHEGTIKKLGSTNEDLKKKPEALTSPPGSGSGSSGANRDASSGNSPAQEPPPAGGKAQPAGNESDDNKTTPDKDSAKDQT